MSVPAGSQPKPGPLARAISAQFRVLMAEKQPRMTARALAERAGLSRSYLGKRLRDEASLTSNDIEALCAALDIDIMTFANLAVGRLERP